MRILNRCLAILILLPLTACTSVLSRQVRDDSLPALPLKELLENVHSYEGRTVILGGYILQTENAAASSTLWVLQAPLDAWEEPRERDKSAGRLVVSHQGFLDPKIYRPDRLVTLAGTVTGLLQDDAGLCVFPCLKLTSREIYLWPEYPAYDYFLYDEPYYYHPYYGYGVFWYPYYPSRPYDDNRYPSRPSWRK